MPALSILRHPDYNPQPVMKVRDAQRPAGLVLTQTSDTQDGWHQIDKAMTRLKAMKKSVITGARLHEETRQRGFRVKPAFLTLTYRAEVEWEPLHMSQLLKRIREHLRRRGCKYFRYVWVMELTKAGKPHFHAMIWLPKGITLPKPDKQGWWPHGMTEIKWAKKAVGYMAKYASKGWADENGKAHALPEGARICAVGGLNADQRNEKAWWSSPVWVRDLWGMDDRPRRTVGGGWMALRTGEWRPSPYEVSINRQTGGIQIRRLVEQIVYLDDCIELSLLCDKTVRELKETAPVAGYTVSIHTGLPCSKEVFTDFSQLVSLSA